MLGLEEQTLRMKIGWMFDDFADFISRIGVRVRNPECKCSSCTRDWERLMDEYSELESSFWYAADALKEIQKLDSTNAVANEAIKVLKLK